MARNYKTGPRRSRRRPDPGLVPGINPNVWPLKLFNNGSTTLTVSVNIFPTNPESGVVAPIGKFLATGRQPEAYVIDSAGTKVGGGTLVDNGDGTWTINISGAVVAGAAQIFIPALGHAVRGDNGEWWGSGVVDAVL